MQNEKKLVMHIDCFTNFTANMADLDPRCLREKLAKWDAKTDPVAPLSDEQKDSVMDLTTLASYRALPTEVGIVIKFLSFNFTAQVNLFQLPVDDFPRIISKSNLSNKEIATENLLGDKHFPVKNFQEVIMLILKDFYE